MRAEVNVETCLIRRVPRGYLPVSETLSRQISAGYENHLVRSATRLSSLMSGAAPPGTGSSTNDLQVAADYVEPSQRLPTAKLFRRSTHDHPAFHLQSRRHVLPSAAFRCSSFRSGAVYARQAYKCPAWRQVDLPPVRCSLAD